MTTLSPTKRILILCLHWGVILHFLIEICYAGYMVFIVFQPESGGGPLMSRATEIPFELMVTRRLYAIECWIATAGLAIYLAITEIKPRLTPPPPSSVREDT
jgi:hypothetical protein